VVGDGARNRAEILRRRQRLLVATVSSVTLSAATARAQVCLSIEPPEPTPCAERRRQLEPLTPEKLLVVADCLAEQEGNLQEARSLYEQYLRQTETSSALGGTRERTRWKIDRIDLLLAASGASAPATPSATERAPDPSQPKPTASATAAPAETGAPRTGGAASCGCAVDAGASSVPKAGAATLALAALLRRRRERKR
jgi:MYXO-CTERM domain-containing protein